MTAIGSRTWMCLHRKCRESLELVPFSNSCTTQAGNSPLNRLWCSDKLPVCLPSKLKIAWSCHYWKKWNQFFFQQGRLVHYGFFGENTNWKNTYYQYSFLNCLKNTLKSWKHKVRICWEVKKVKEVVSSFAVTTCGLLLLASNVKLDWWLLFPLTNLTNSISLQNGKTQFHWLRVCLGTSL